MNQKKSPTQADKPRFGGVDETGAWTGGGEDGDPTTPRSHNCYRKVHSNDILKCAQFLANITTACKKGLSDKPCGLLFASPEEPNTDKFVATLRACHEEIKECGLEGPFLITTR